MLPRSTTSPFFRRIFSILCFLSMATVTISKKVSGSFRLSGEDTEYLLGSFAVLPTGGSLTVNLEASKPYPNERHLKLRLYRDVEWPKYLKALTCREKIKQAKHIESISFEEADNNRKLKASKVIAVFNSPLGEPDSGRPHYWYFVIDDCTLEEYFQDSAVPTIHYDLTVQNYFGPNRQLTHLSADEQSLTFLHMVTLVLSGLVFVLLGMRILFGLTTGKNSIHAALLWVAAAAAFDAASSLCEILHIQIYKSNGTGSYLIDALAAHLEAVCDTLLVLLLLSIGSGWTLPSDVIPVSPSTNATSLQRLLQEMSMPMGSIRHLNAAGALGIAVLVLHIILAQWGRTYNDDFESYHDFEHLPGKILMMLRIILGFLLVAATMQTRLKCNVKQLQKFYLLLAAFGFAWFQSLPLLTWICNTFVPYYMRKPAVFVGSALCQSSSILLFSWLVTSHSSTYHQFSHMAAPSEQTLTDQLNQRNDDAEPRTWKLGKAKVRLD